MSARRPEQPHVQSCRDYSLSGPHLAQGIVIVPQQMAWVVERFGRYDRVLDPGLTFLIPYVQKIKYVFSLKEDAISVPSQTAIVSCRRPSC